jgi:hypothetical protein
VQKRKPLNVVAPQGVGSLTSVVKYELPPAKGACKMNFCRQPRRINPIITRRSKTNIIMAILFLVEIAEGKVKKASFEAASYASNYANSVGKEAVGLALGSIDDASFKCFRHLWC